MDKQLVELYHSSGWMPDWVYYQVNGKTAQENYMEQRKSAFATDIEDDVMKIQITSEVKLK